MLFFFFFSLYWSRVFNLFLFNIVINIKNLKVLKYVNVKMIMMDVDVALISGNTE